MANRLEGKVAIVTGAASGMGRATSLAFAREGARVAVVDIDEQGADVVAKEIVDVGGEAIALRIDVSSADDMRTMVDSTVSHFGRLDVLDNNAALLGPAAHAIDKDVVNIEPDAWERIFAVNMRGPYLGCKFAVPAMIESGGGSIINISSVSSLTGYPVSHAYGSSKAGVNALTWNVAAAYGKQGIRCNAIAPGPIRTATAWADVSPGHAALVERNLLTPYVGEPKHVAETAVFLASTNQDTSPARSCASTEGTCRTNLRPGSCSVEDDAEVPGSLGCRGRRTYRPSRKRREPVTSRNLESYQRMLESGDFANDITSERSRQAMMEAFTSDFVIVVPPSLPQGGVWEGIEEWLKMNKMMGTLWEAKNMPQKIWDFPDDNVLVLYSEKEWTSKASGTALTFASLEVLHFRDAKICKVEMFLQDTKAILDALEPQ